MRVSRIVCPRPSYLRWYTPSPKLTGATGGAYLALPVGLGQVSDVDCANVCTAAPEAMEWD